MSQNDEYFNRRGVTKRSCYCTLIFHFENVSVSSTALAVLTLNRKPFKCHELEGPKQFRVYRGLQRDVVIRVQMQGVAGSQQMSTAVHIT